MPQPSARTGQDRRQEILKRTLEGLESDLEDLRDHLGTSYEAYEERWESLLSRLPRWVDVRLDEVRPLLSLGEEDGLRGAIGPHLVAVVAGEIEQFVARWLGARGQLTALDVEDRELMGQYREEAQRLRRQLDTLSRLIDRAGKQVRQQLGTLRDDILADVEEQRVRDTEALEQLVGSGALERGRDARAEIARLWEEQRRNADELIRAWSQLDVGIDEGIGHMQRGLAELRSLLKRAQDGLYVVYPSLLAPERAISAVASRRDIQPQAAARAPEARAPEPQPPRPRATTADIAALRPLPKPVRPAVEDEFDPYKMGSGDEGWPQDLDWGFDESPEPPMKRSEPGPLVDFFEEDDATPSSLYVSTVGGAPAELGLESSPVLDENEIFSDRPIAQRAAPAQRAPHSAAQAQRAPAAQPARISFAEEFEEESAPTEEVEEFVEEILDAPLADAAPVAHAAAVSSAPVVEIEREEQAQEPLVAEVEDEAAEVEEEVEAPTPAPAPRPAARPVEPARRAPPEPVFAPCVRRRKGATPVQPRLIALTIGLPLAIAGGVIAAAAAARMGAGVGNPLSSGLGVGVVVALLAWAMISPWVMRWQVRWRGAKPEFSQRAMLRDEVQLEATEEYVALGPWEMPWEELDEVARERWIEAEGDQRGWMITLQHPSHGIHMIAAPAEDARSWNDAGTPIVRVPPGAWHMDAREFALLDAQAQHAKPRAER